MKTFSRRAGLDNLGERKKKSYRSQSTPRKQVVAFSLASAACLVKLQLPLALWFRSILCLEPGGCFRAILPCGMLRIVFPCDPSIRQKGWNFSKIRASIKLAHPVVGNGLIKLGWRILHGVSQSLLVPAAVRNGLDRAGLNHRPVLLSIDTDVRLDGFSEQEWLVVTDDHLTMMNCAEEGQVLRSLSVADISKYRIATGVGSGILQAKVADNWFDILRFSNALAGRYYKVLRRLEAMLEEGSTALTATPLHGEEGLDPIRCETCRLRLASKDESCPRCLQKGQILRRVAELVRPHLRGALYLTVLTIIGVVAELIPPKLQQYMVDHILGTQAGQPANVGIAGTLLVVVLALAASRFVLSWVGVVKGRLAAIIGTGLTSTLRAQMVERLQKLAVVYYDRHQVGSTLSRVAHDSEVLHGLVHQLTGGFLLQIVQLFGVGAMLVWLNPKLAVFTLIPVPLVFLGSWVFWRMVYPRYYRLWDASSKQMAVLNGMLSGIRVVKAFAQEQREYDRFSHANDHLRQWRLWVDHTNAWYSAAMQLVFSLGGLIVWYVGGRDVIGREMSLGELIAFLAYLAMFYAPLSALSNFTSWLTSFLSGSKRVLELLDMPLTIPEPTNPTSWNDPKGAVEFNRVTFGYDPNQPVLKEISFQVQPGEMIGIVGRSGSGKTTMVNLLSRFYDVQEGNISIDGIDIRELSTQSLREHVGIVFQESFLFRGTIWKNLSYGRPLVSIEEGITAARAAGAHDFICRKQLGYETLLGEHGAGLSGGEKQRLSIARTLLYNPRILVLDEATSNIDAESEKSIQEALEVLIKGRTTIAIAHRLSTLRNADRIFVFDRGHISEQGSHKELLELDGTYAKLVRIQTQVSKDPNVDRLVQRMQDEADSELLSENEPAVPEEVQENDSPKVAKHPIHWLEPMSTEFRFGSNHQIELLIDGIRAGGGVFIVQTFPASHPREYFSVRGIDQEGEEIEFGMIRSIDDWSEESRKVVFESLNRRYLMREITRFHKIELKYGFLDFDVETESGRFQFSMRWTSSQAVDFGENGKLLIDTEENRYLVRDLSKFSSSQQELFMQYVYW
jgi:ATP-binding cassette subfamily B protein